jgi:hypothetical protein
LWYDRRDNPDNRSYHARFSASLDGGATWTPSARVSTEPYAAGPVSRQSAFSGNGGDTAGLAAAADGVFLRYGWTTARASPRHGPPR